MACSGCATRCVRAASEEEFTGTIWRLSIRTKRHPAIASVGRPALSQAKTSESAVNKTPDKAMRSALHMLNSKLSLAHALTRSDSK